MEWIKIDDQLPSKGEVVLLYQKWPPETMFNCRADPLQRNFTHLGGLRYDGLFIDYQNQYGEPLKYISHWAKLPEKPK